MRCFKNKRICSVIFYIGFGFVWFLFAKVLGFIIHSATIWDFNQIILIEGFILISEGFLISIAIDFLSIPEESDVQRKKGKILERISILKRHMIFAFNKNTLLIAGSLCILFTYL
ncbi:MAG: hypothetical protein RR840_01155 [Clostridium sp.]